MLSWKQKNVSVHCHVWRKSAHSTNRTTWDTCWLSNCKKPCSSTLNSYWYLLEHNGSKILLENPKRLYGYWLASWFSNLRPFWTFFDRFTASHASSFQFQNIVVYPRLIASVWEAPDPHNTWYSIKKNPTWPLDNFFMVCSNEEAICWLIFIVWEQSSWYIKPIFYHNLVTVTVLSYKRHRWQPRMSQKLIVISKD